MQEVYHKKQFMCKKVAIPAGMRGKSKERKFKRQRQRYLPRLPSGEQNFLVGIEITWM